MKVNRLFSGADPLVRGRRPRRPVGTVQQAAKAGPGGPARTWGSAPLCLLLATAAVALAQNPPTMFPPVRGTREMVGAANNVEVEAGFRMLTQGGNAVDAGVATALAAAVTEQDHFGLGGEIPMLDRKSTRLNSSHQIISYAVFFLKKY